MKNLLVLILLVFLASCTSDILTPALRNNQVSYEVNSVTTGFGSSASWINCVSTTGRTLVNDSVQLYKIGMYHNYLLQEVDGLVDISDCTVGQIIAMEETLDSIIASNEHYVDVFGSYANRELINPGFYFDKINWCEEYSSAEYLNVISSIFSDAIDTLTETELFSSTELNLLSSFFSLMIANGGVSKVDVEGYYTTILTNKHNYFLDGNFSLSLLVIYDYSFCYWQEGVRPRWLLALALTDWAGGLVGGVANIVRNRHHYNNGCGTCTDVDLLEDIGRGAAGASSGPLGYFF